ncbi:MAG: sodium:alanine symporter family protein [Peptococcaceae bacterium]|jgi:AGCS family alanine or glycine:cation symporter|nr:sodium:alanine symporter family protein [Peptococcaceae bacterium]MBQ2004044.1 sodium:alanine symporter family protein [Peptococcaceae bacterium]MBQ2369204.1 sodium:alanine symporter family protein [Peptococcaceae bacterium]MBQ5615466.1 sodium:alanine symporter family protein [Peptococcaceae bacterium]MBQ5658273.1 sodium:alanine symporter family protein [Peptococcaceae bacterium]
MLDLVASINGVLWGPVLLILLCGTGIYYTFRLKFIQVRKFGEACKLLFGHITFKGGERKEGEMTPFQALSTAIAAQVGTGNLAGAATALVMGGPGAIFWMWISAFFGMATIYGEATLAQTYKTTTDDGEVTGGPVYYIQAAFKGTLGKVLATLFAIFIILALGFMGNMVQSNSIGVAFESVFTARGIAFNPIIVGVILAVFAAFIFIGGTKRLAAVVEKVVPFMAMFYILGSLFVIFMNITEVPNVLRLIVECAFNPAAAGGAAVGITIQQAVRYGVARGLFSNEAGMGSTPHAHARAAAKNPHEQGLVAMLSVFIDTFIVLNMTVFVILTSGVWDSGATGIALTQSAFVSVMGGFGDIFVALCLLFFAGSTILSWHFFAAVNVKWLFGEAAVKVYSSIVLIFIVVGSTLKVNLVWELADLFNGLMVFPNLLALLALSGVVAASSKKFDKKN